MDGARRSACRGAAGLSPAPWRHHPCRRALYGRRHMGGAGFSPAPRRHQRGHIGAPASSRSARTAWVVSHGCRRLLPDGRSTTGIPVRVRRSRSSCRVRCPPWLSATINPLVRWGAIWTTSLCSTWITHRQLWPVHDSITSPVTGLSFASTPLLLRPERLCRCRG